jgi:nitroimidazol reductase NimA-like FMN-containing flavoprotein (pyridoxamine 5'-phosphate oxidase superfamily)
VTDYGVEYASVVLRGIVSIVSDPAAVRRVFDMQMAKYFPTHRAGIEFQTFTDEEAARATVYEMKVLEWSAKKHVSDAGHEGAFRYADDFFSR